MSNKVDFFLTDDIHILENQTLQLFKRSVLVFTHWDVSCNYGVWVIQSKSHLSYEMLLNYFIEIKKELDFQTAIKIFNPDDIYVMRRYADPDDVRLFLELLTPTDFNHFKMYLFQLIKTHPSFNLIEAMFDVYIPHVLHQRWIEFEHLYLKLCHEQPFKYINEIVVDYIRAYFRSQWKEFNDVILERIGNDYNTFVRILIYNPIFISVCCMGSRWIGFEQKVMDLLEHHITAKPDQTELANFVIKQYTSEYLDTLNEWKEFKDYLSKHPELKIK